MRHVNTDSGSAELLQEKGPGENGGTSGAGDGGDSVARGKKQVTRGQSETAVPKKRTKKTSTLACLLFFSALLPM